MLGYRVEATKGLVAATENEQIFYPRLVRPGIRGVVLCHGANNPSEYIDTTNQPSSVKLAAALASAGFPCIAGDFGGQTWANDTAMSRVDAAWALLKTKFSTMATDQMLLLGASMGGAVAARYTQLHPTNVAAFVGIIPLLDLVAYYQANPGATATEIGNAWGVTAPADLPSGADIASNASAAASVPTLLGYSTADPVINPSWVTSYGQKVGAQIVVTSTSAGHTDAAIGGMPIPTVGGFLADYGR